MFKLYSIILIVFLSNNLASQDFDGMITNKSLGYQFENPQGWSHQDLQNGNHLFGHNQIPGLIAVMAHGYSDREKVLKLVQVEGIEDGAMQLYPVGLITDYSSNGLNGTFEGLLDGQQVKSTVISLFSPYGGGLTVFAATSKEKFDSTYHDLAKNLADSVTFTKPIESASTKQWHSFLGNRKLTYYKTNDDVAEKMVFFLYENGWFRFFDESFYGTTEHYTDHSYSFSSLVTEENAGQWKVISKGSNDYLFFTYNDGSEYSPSLAMKEGSQSQILLSGKRFFTESF